MQLCSGSALDLKESLELPYITPKHSKQALSLPGKSFITSIKQCGSNLDYLGTEYTQVKINPKESLRESLEILEIFRFTTF